MKQKQPRSWTWYFGRSSLGKGIYFIRGSTRIYGHVVFGIEQPEAYCADAIIKACRRLEVPCSQRTSGSPGGNADDWSADYALLDGGVSYRDGNYFWGRVGAWVIGRRTLRFLCYELGIPQPPLWRGEARLPFHEELVAEALGQLEEMETLKRRLERYERDDYWTRDEPVVTNPATVSPQGPPVPGP